MGIRISKDIKIKTLTQPIVGYLNHAHCSGVVAFPDGEVFAVWYWAVKEADSSQNIYGSRKKPNGDWSVPFLIKEHPIKMVGNPAIWIAPDTGRLWLFYVRSIGGWSVCNPRYIYSDDRGKTWSKAKKLYWFVSRGIKNPPILTSKGWYILPAYVEFRDYFSIFYVSNNQGKSWKDVGARVKIPDEEVPDDIRKNNKKDWGRLVLQPTVIERKDGTLIALMRAKRPLGKMYYTESTDGGLSWTQAKPYILPNPGGGFHWIRLNSGNLAIIYNHAPVLEEGHKYERNPLSVALSEDDGKTWAYRRNIMEAHDENLHDRIGGYPTIYQDENGLIHCIWTFSYRKEINGKEYGFSDIKYCTITEEWIKQKKFYTTVWEDSSSEIK